MGRRLRVGAAGFGAYLYDAMMRQRNAHGAAWSSVDLAEALYVSPEAVRQWLANERLPQAESLARLVQILTLDAAESLAKVIETSEEMDRLAAKRALEVVVKKGRAGRKG